MNRAAVLFRRMRTAEILVGGLLLLGTFGGQGVSAEEKNDEHRLDRAFFARFGRDLRDVVSAPARWGGGDFLTLAAVSGTGILLFAFDQDIQDWAQDRRTPSSEKAASFFSFIGNGGILLGLSAGLYAAGEIGHQDGLRQTALLSIESLGTASLILWTIKVIAGRARPYTGETSGSFHPFAFKSSYWSLPSGHAAASFSVATAIAEQAESPLIDVLAYGLATLVAVSRVHDNKHWASDVFLGSALGYFVGKKICDLNKRRDESGVTLGLDWAGGRRALTLSIVF
jgi:membrane-associated phospholipid phosphatase